MARRKEPDVVVTAEGTVWTFSFDTARAIRWAHKNLATEGWQWLGRRTLVVDHRPAHDLLDHIRAESGLNIAAA